MIKGAAMSFTAALQTAQLLKESEFCGKKPDTSSTVMCFSHTTCTELHKTKLFLRPLGIYQEPTEKCKC